MGIGRTVAIAYLNKHDAKQLVEAQNRHAVTVTGYLPWQVKFRILTANAGDRLVKNPTIYNSGEIYYLS